MGRKHWRQESTVACSVGRGGQAAGMLTILFRGPLKAVCVSYFPVSNITLTS